MPGKRFTTEQIIQHLREAEVLLSLGKTVAQVCKQIDKQIRIVKQLGIRGKTVTVPETLTENPGVTDEPVPDHKAARKAKREQRRKAREEARPYRQQQSDKQPSRSPN